MTRGRTGLAICPVRGPGSPGGALARGSLAVGGFHDRQDFPILFSRLLEGLPHRLLLRISPVDGCTTGLAKRSRRANGPGRRFHGDDGVGGPRAPSRLYPASACVLVVGGIAVLVIDGLVLGLFFMLFQAVKTEGTPGRQALPSGPSRLSSSEKGAFPFVQGPCWRGKQQGSHGFPPQTPPWLFGGQ